MNKIERIAKYGIEAYNRMLEKNRISSKQYRINHKQEISEYQKQYYQDHKEEKSEYWKQYNSTQVGRADNLIGAYRKLDNKYNRGECTLTTDWIINNIFNSKCVFCGESDWTKLGCDRIDNSKPHTEDNVQCCCGKCNVKKHTFTIEEYLEKIKTVL